MNGEYEIAIAKRHKFCFFTPILFSVIFLFIFPPITILILVVSYLSYKNTMMVITNKRITISNGIFTKKSKSIPINKINSVNIKSGLIERKIGYGTLSVLPATSMDSIVFSFCPDLENIKYTIDNAIDEFKVNISI